MAGPETPEMPGMPEDVPEDFQPTPFLMLIGGLGAQVQMSLGMLPDPTTGKRARELPAAQQGIDILACLEEKTRGNLDDEERAFLSTLLTQLRLLYVEATKQSGDDENDGDAGGDESPIVTP